MKIRRWELTTTEDGEKETSYHRTQSAAFSALADRWIPALERNGIPANEDSGITDGIITDEEEFRDSLSCYLDVDYWIEEEIINTDEWEVVQ